MALAAAAAVAVPAQTKPAFEVATIKPSPPMDQARILAAMQAGGKMPIGTNIDAHRAEYRYLDLKTLISYAYGIKPYQITGPDWLQTTRFDVVATMPEGSSKDDANKMLRTLLEERFQLTTHRTNAEHPVLALVVGKGGPKLKASTEKPVAIDENAPLKPGELKMDGQDGPVRMKVDIATGSSVIDMGLRGKMAYRIAPATRTLSINFSMATLNGFADMMTQLFAQVGGTGGRQVVDMTEIQGNYDASVELSLMEILAMARAAGADIPAGAVPARAPAEGGNIPVAADPGGGDTSLNDAVQAMGLKLESRKAMVEQLMVDHIEKTPSEN